MPMENRYATYTTAEDIDMVTNNIKKYGGTITSISSNKDGYLILYKADNKIEERVLKEF